MPIRAVDPNEDERERQARVLTELRDAMQGLVGRRAWDTTRRVAADRAVGRQPRRERRGVRRDHSSSGKIA